MAITTGAEESAQDPFAALLLPDELTGQSSYELLRKAWIEEERQKRTEPIGRMGLRGFVGRIHDRFSPRE